MIKMTHSFLRFQPLCSAIYRTRQPNGASRPRIWLIKGSKVTEPKIAESSSIPIIYIMGLLNQVYGRNYLKPQPAGVLRFLWDTLLDLTAPIYLTVTL